MAAQTAAVNTADKTSVKSPGPIKTRTEKQEKIFRLLQESLSRKISERFSGEKVEKEASGKEKVAGGGGGGGGGGRGEGGGGGREGSVSPSSTVSSSEEVEGIYTIYTNSLSSGDESGEASCDQSHDYLFTMLYSVLKCTFTCIPLEQPFFYCCLALPL